MLEFYEIQKLQDNAYKLLGNKERRNIDNDRKEDEIKWNYSLFIANILV